MRYSALGCFSLFLIAATARADWLEASSDHFVIYGDQSERDVGEFAERLDLAIGIDLDVELGLQ